MKFNENQMRRQQGYSFALFSLEALQKQGILIKSEMREAEKIVANKYRPIIRFYF
jgi:hypothetical protein